MACACGKNRASASASATVPVGTFRVMVGARKVYETTNQSAAEQVAKNFAAAHILAPGETA